MGLMFSTINLVLTFFPTFFRFFDFAVLFLNSSSNVVFGVKAKENQDKVPT